MSKQGNTFTDYGPYFNLVTLNMTKACWIDYNVSTTEVKKNQNQVSFLKLGFRYIWKNATSRKHSIYRRLKDVNGKSEHVKNKRSYSGEWMAFNRDQGRIIFSLPWKLNHGKCISTCP